MAVHLHSVSDAVTPPDDIAPATAIDQVFFVLQRANGSWSPAAKIMAVFELESDAEIAAEQFKSQHPQQTFGVAALRSEARHVAKPIHIVRVVDPPCDTERLQ